MTCEGNSNLFLWMCATDLGLQHVGNAKYAIVFGMTPSGAQDLFYLLLQFMSKYIRDGDYCRFNVVGLSYRRGLSRTFGVLLFAPLLGSVYQQAWVKPRLQSSNYSWRYNLSLSTWTSKCNALNPKVAKKPMIGIK
ncbi:hypothetical protein C8R45DRAFT_849361 [Mycena sanguinolenta]|nr:hypothetical protein C8R45DRAFT_849361 [Mycena sanguinolenta]